MYHASYVGIWTGVQQERLALLSRGSQEQATSVYPLKTPRGGISWKHR